MPPPRSRRTAARTTTERAPEVEAEPGELIEVEDPTVDTTAAPAAEGSGRRGASGKRPPSGRNRPTSGRQATGRSSRRELTPEQRAARSRSVKTVFGILFGLILLGAAGFGAWWQFIRVDERQQNARNGLSAATAHVAAVEKALMNRQAEVANEAYVAAIKDLNIPELGYGKDSANETDPQFAGLATWEAARKLNVQLREDIHPRIEKCKRDAAVVQNLDEIVGRFGRLTELDDAGLAQLEKDANKFMDNPVEPEAGRVDERVKEYPSQITGIKVRMASIAEETKRRREKMTSEPERLAHREANTLIEQERFKDALAKIDEMQRQFKDADLGKVRAMIEGAAKATWDSASKFAETNWVTANSPGSDGAQSRTAVEAAKRRMNEVVERFGIDEYVNKAKEALARYNAPR